MPREQHDKMSQGILLSAPFASISSPSDTSAIPGVRGGGKRRVSSMSREKVTGVECFYKLQS